LLLALTLLWPLSPSSNAWQKQTAPAQATATVASDSDILRECKTEKPTELFTLTRVVDGDTIWIDRYGKREKLRLLSVDTEEKFMEGGDLSDSKPSTRFGDECTGWAQGFFAPRTEQEDPVRVGLSFPGGVEARDVYGRLLCHVVTAEGIDFNLLLVRRGLSPYFNKYGNSLLYHERFVSAQKAAQAEERGIWNKKTNIQGSRRPYERLLPWWTARAEAIESFRKKAQKDPIHFVDAEVPAALEGALKDGPVRVTALGSVYKIYPEDDGSRTVLLRSGDKEHSLRVVIPKDQVRTMEEFDLEGSIEDFRQNYLLIDGNLERGPRGFYLVDVKPSDWRRAGPEPKFQ
ncbi:MAG TPA: thermonuclease family protein, partial [Planctomycetota bacterium]|nr:thermonuclease family protein [Planctomycetota bacterium]